MPVFADDIVNLTELKTNQKKVFMRVKGNQWVTVTQPNAPDLAIVERRQWLTNVSGLQHLFALVRYLNEVEYSKEQAPQSTEFPWTNFLSEKDRKEFGSALLRTALLCAESGKWDEFVELIDDWRATAEANRNPELLRAWLTRGNSDEYEDAADRINS